MLQKALLAAYSNVSMSAETDTDLRNNGYNIRSLTRIDQH